MIKIILSILFPALALATYSPNSIITDATSGNTAAVSVTNGLLVDQGAANATPWNVNFTNSSLAVTGTFWQATQPVSGALTCNAGTNLNTSALALDSNLTAFKSANHTDLGTLNTTLGSPFQAGGSIGNTSFAATQGTVANLNATVVTTGGATIAKDSSLSTINTTLGSPFQAGGSIGNTTFASTQSGNWNLQYNTINTAASAATGTVSTVITLTAPSNAIGFIIQAEDDNTANMRYVVGGTATTSTGLELQPGRDSGFVPVGANISLVAESGTQTYSVQWISTH